MTAKTELMSLRQAAALGIRRVRRPIWTNPCDHVELFIFDGRLGRWVHLWAPFNTMCNGHDPVPLTLSGDIDVPEYEEYTGPIGGSDEYQREVGMYSDARLDDEHLWKS